jgi:outer membrane protein assembly factor BamE (lipoprotein component of BamABCDE complex)
MKKNYNIIFIGIFVIFLISCSGSPRRYLSIDAGLINKGQTKEELTNMLGPPHATRIKEPDKEEWYYYQVNEPFYYNIPLLGNKIAEKRIESIRILFQDNRVVDVLYYLPAE